LGVLSVWMKMLRLPLTACGRSIADGWCSGWRVGRRLGFAAAIAGNLVL
jgi:hypothetical protein